MSDTNSFVVTTRVYTTERRGGIVVFWYTAKLGYRLNEVISYVIYTLRNARLAHPQGLEHSAFLNVLGTEIRVQANHTVNELLEDCRDLEHRWNAIPANTRGSRASNLADLEESDIALMDKDVTAPSITRNEGKRSALKIVVIYMSAIRETNLRDYLVRLRGVARAHDADYEKYNIPKRCRVESTFCSVKIMVEATSDIDQILADYTRGVQSIVGPCRGSADKPKPKRRLKWNEHITK